jgi:hypothetical protein
VKERSSKMRVLKMESASVYLDQNDMILTSGYSTSDNTGS